MNWHVEWTPSANASLDNLARRDAAMARRIREAVWQFAETNRGDVRKLSGRTNQFRLRVGDWRVVFTFRQQEMVILVLRVGPRDSIYRG